MKFIKRLRSAAINALREKLAQRPSMIGPHDHWAVSYTLNPILVDVMRQPGCGTMYTWGALQGARLAKQLGIGRVSMIEFGVGGGNGLIHLEKISAQLESRFGIEIEIFGFDTGKGMPPPTDYRDMPNLWSEGFFEMDEQKLRGRLTRAELLLGPVKETIVQYMRAGPPPVAFVSFDMDYYSSTVDALQLFEGQSDLLLPRVHCYFDEVLGYTFGDHVGERLAITEFNEKNAMRKISQIHGLRAFMPPALLHMLWERYFMLHVFDHRAYGDYDGIIDPSGCRLSI